MADNKQQRYWPSNGPGDSSPLPSVGTGWPSPYKSDVWQSSGSSSPRAGAQFSTGKEGVRDLPPDFLLEDRLRRAEKRQKEQSKLIKAQVAELKAQTAELTSLSKKLDDLETTAKDQGNLLDQNNNELQQGKNDKLQSIQILALFVAFFTFVSVEFQLFTSLKQWGAVAGLSLILLGSLLVFVCMTYLGLAYYDAKVIGAKKSGLAFNRTFLLLMVGVALVCMMGGMWMGYHSDNEQQSTCAELAKAVNTAAGADSQSSRAIDFAEERYRANCASN